MRLIRSIRTMQNSALALKRRGKKIAFVPTMGYLHEGHLSLMRLARRKGDVLVVSIFVNPAQFGPREDFSRYPRDLRRDLALCRRSGADVVFAPAAKSMYPEGYSAYVEETRLSRGLCGARRPGHFRGVATVVLKLFAIVQPDLAVFGLKDFQQSRVIRKMASDLNLPVTILAAPTVREKDGLAMSSRNTFLNPSERREALCLRRALLQARRMAQTGERDGRRIRAAMRRIVEREPSARIDYLEIVDGEDLRPVRRIEPGARAALAVFIGKTRLIDNIKLK
ncbi:MAG: pantoate--beta-alanine ligase [Candidatus Aureabacteria bacterium]|nr:pantoate--beta-alanine ligase [Candidatus Auribacterota bacterium]